jgi:hypothetical protein
MKDKITAFFLIITMTAGMTLLVPALGQAIDLTITWSPVYSDNPVGYRVYFREQGQDYDFRFPIWEGEETECTIYGLNENNAYFFVLRTHDFLGNESMSSGEVSYNAGVASAPTTDGSESDAGSNNGGSVTNLDNNGNGCFIQSVQGGRLKEVWIFLARQITAYLPKDIALPSFLADISTQKIHFPRDSNKP